MKHIQIFIFILGLTFIGCNTSHSHNDQPLNELQYDQADEIAFTLDQAKNAGLEYGFIEKKNIKSTVNLIGRVELPPTGRIAVSSKLDGEIVGVHIIEGQRIARYQNIFTIQNMDLIEWKESWLGLLSRIDYLDNEITRQKTLTDEQLAPIKNFESLKAERDQAIYKVKALEAKFNAIGQKLERNDTFVSVFKVRAHSGGILQNLIASKGQFVQKGDKLANIIDNHHLHLHLSVYSEDIHKLKVGQEILFNVHSNPSKVFTAHIKWIDAFVNKENNSYQLHAEIEEGDHYFAVGEFVEARVVNEEDVVMVLPESAIVQDKGLSFIFIKEDEHDDEIHFSKVQIRTGISDMGYVEVTPIDGVQLDQEVVISGAFYLMAHSKKSSGESAHSH